MEYERPDAFCRAPGGRCTMMSECYPNKLCQHEPIPDDADNVLEFPAREAEEFSRALGGSAIFVSEDAPAPTPAKCQLVVNGKVVAECDAPTIHAGDTVTISWTFDL